MNVALSQVIPNSLSLSQTASRCSSLHTFLKGREHKQAHLCSYHTHTHSHQSNTRVIGRTQKKLYYHFAVCNPQQIWQKASIVTKTLFHGCLMMFYHTVCIVFTYLNKNIYLKKKLLFRILMSVKGAIDMLVFFFSGTLPLLFLFPSPYFCRSSRSYIFTKVPFSLLSFHQRLSKEALILKAGLEWKGKGLGGM